MYVKLHFALTDATYWMSDYNGINYKEFHKFIVDFFEADQSIEGTAAATELLKWWNKYVTNSISHSGARSYSFPGRYSHSLLQHEQRHLCLHTKYRLRCCKISTTANLAHLMPPPSFIVVSKLPFIYPNTITCL